MSLDLPSGLSPTLPHEMAETYSPVSRLSQASYFARVTRRDGPAVEEAMAGATLFTDGARLDGAIVEAAYAFDRPPLLKRLKEDQVPRIIDLQTLRFAGERYLETAALRRLPYAPDAPITAETFNDAAAVRLARGGLAFSQDRGADFYLAPTVPLFDRHTSQWLNHFERLLRATCVLNGAGELERRPLIAQVAPGAKAMAQADVVL